MGEEYKIRTLKERKKDREEMFRLAKKYGWKKWGTYTKRMTGHSFYQCFRKGNRYIWIGDMFIEHPLYPHSLQYHIATLQEKKKFLI